MTAIVPSEHGYLTPLMDGAQAKAAMQKLADIKRNLLEASDYQQIKDKKFIKRSGCRKLQFAFGISDELLKKEREVLDGNIVYTVTVRAFHKGSSAESIGVAMCSSGEKGRKDSAHLEHDLLAIAHTRAKNRAILDIIGSGEVSYEEVDTAQPTTQGPSHDRTAEIEKAWGKDRLAAADKRV